MNSKEKKGRDAKTKERKEMNSTGKARVLEQKFTHQQSSPGL
jgi:hypothetical protein